MRIQSSQISHSFAVANFLSNILQPAIPQHREECSFVNGPQVKAAVVMVKQKWGVYVPSYLSQNHQKLRKRATKKGTIKITHEISPFHGQSRLLSEQSHEGAQGILDTPPARFSHRKARKGQPQQTIHSSMRKFECLQRLRSGLLQMVFTHARTIDAIQGRGPANHGNGHKLLTKWGSTSFQSLPFGLQLRKTLLL